MEELGLTGWLPGSNRRIAVRTARDSLDPQRGQSVVARNSAPREGAARSLRRDEATTTMAWLVATAIGAVTLVALASLFGRKK
jgi:hypothetical protein